MSSEHHFEITVRMRADQGDWGTLVTQTVRAYDIKTALELAGNLSLADWFPDEDEERREEGSVIPMRSRRPDVSK